MAYSLKEHRFQVHHPQLASEYRALLQALGDGVVACSSQGVIALWNSGAERLFGYSEEEMLGQSISTLIPERQGIRPLLQLRRTLLESEETLRKEPILEVLGRHKQGDELHLELTLAPWPRRDELFFVAVLRDISKRKQEERAISYQANYDPLTDLPNRKLFTELLDRSIRLSHRLGECFALLFIDLDRFKWVNDTLGHAAGDWVLQESARRLKSGLRESDVIGRMGGDEFTAILHQIDHPEPAALLADKILRTLRQPCWFEGVPIAISASMGIALFPRDGRDRQTLLRNADSAMYVVKETGRDHHGFFATSDQSGDDLAPLGKQLRRA